MADLFGNRGFWQDSGCLSTEKKEGKTEDSDLVLICFQISVWSGPTTEQTSIEEGFVSGDGRTLSQRFRDATAGCCRSGTSPECLEKRILQAPR